MNRRRFLTLGTASIAGLTLVGCGSSAGDSSGQIEVTRIADVAGAPPPLAPNATPPSTSGGGQASPAASPSPGATPVAGGQGGDQPPADQGGQAGGGQPIQLEARDPFAWSTNQLTVSPGQTIVVTNTGFLEHNFAVDEWGVEVDLPNGQPVEVQVPQDAQAGQSFEFYCSVAGHRDGGMVGTVTVA